MRYCFDKLAKVKHDRIVFIPIYKWWNSFVTKAYHCEGCDNLVISNSPINENCKFTEGIISINHISKYVEEDCLPF